MISASQAVAMSAMDKKEIGYFSTHDLGEVLAEVGLAHDPSTVRALTWCMIEDKAHGLVGAIAAGLREAAATGDDGEFARMVSAAAEMVRHDLAEGPVIDALVYVGRSDPNTAVCAADRLVGLGDADYAAFLIGGAYGAAAPRCDALIGRLAETAGPSGVAASLRSLRVAHTTHGSPDASRVADAVDRALQTDDDGVHREAMEALLDIYGADPERVGPMIKMLAMRRQVCKPVLAIVVSADPPFEPAECAEYLDVCIEGASADDEDVVYSAYRTLRALARTRPRDAAKLLAKLAGQGAYMDDRAGLVLEELGRGHPRVASEAVLSLLGRPRGANLDAHLQSIVRSAVKFSSPDAIAEPILAALDSEPRMQRACLSALAALADENRLGERNAAFAERLLCHVRDRALHSGAARGALIAPSRADPNEECRSAIEGLIDKIPPDPGLGSAADTRPTGGGAASRASESTPSAPAGRLPAGGRDDKRPGAR